MKCANLHLSRITSVITEPEQPEPAIIHFKNTRKSGFVCIALLSTAACPYSKARIVTEIRRPLNRANFGTS